MYLKHVASYWMSILFVFAVLASTTTARAEVVRVGIKEAAPFSMKDADGTWTGVSVDLWEDIARYSSLKVSYIEVKTVPDMLEQLASGSLDVGVGALTMDAEREEVIDFSYAFLSSGVGVAVSTAPASIWSAVADVWTLGFFKAVGGLAVLLCIVGVIIWLAERKSNEQFGGNSIFAGIANGFWWSAVTMTTVGYGDKAPVTPIGRALGVIWMFAGVITISGFTAAIAASFTTSSLNSKITTIADLPKARIVTLAGSSSEAILKLRNLEYETVEDLPTGLNALVRGKAEALIYDEPLLRYVLQESSYSNIALLGQSLANSEYAFGLRPGMEQREDINRALLALLNKKKWKLTKNVYLGSH